MQNNRVERNHRGAKKKQTKKKSKKLLKKKNPIYVKSLKLLPVKKKTLMRT